MRGFVFSNTEKKNFSVQLNKGLVANLSNALDEALHNISLFGEYAHRGAHFLAAKVGVFPLEMFPKSLRCSIKVEGMPEGEQPGEGGGGTNPLTATYR